MTFRIHWRCSSTVMHRRILSQRCSATVVEPKHDLTDHRAKHSVSTTFMGFHPSQRYSQSLGAATLWRSADLPAVFLNAQLDIFRRADDPSIRFKYFGGTSLNSFSRGSQVFTTGSIGFRSSPFFVAPVLGCLGLCFFQVLQTPTWRDRTGSQPVPSIARCDFRFRTLSARGLVLCRERCQPYCPPTPDDAMTSSVLKRAMPCRPDWVRPPPERRPV
jgi:hypothetical protein